MLSVERFKRRIKNGVYFPPFIYISILNSCNLRCQGCWVDVEAPQEAIALQANDPADAIRRAKHLFIELRRIPDWTLHADAIEVATLPSRTRRKRGKGRAEV